MPQTLEYAAPRDAAPWGPVFVRPSRRSIVLFLLTAAVATWVGFRHDPWALAASIKLPTTVPATPTLQVFTTVPLTFRPTPPAVPNIDLQDDFLLTYDDDVEEVRVWDTSTGRLLRTMGQETGPGLHFPIGYYIADRGRYVLARSLGRHTAGLIDPPTGRIVSEAVGLPPPGRVIDVSAAASPADHVVLYAEESSVSGRNSNGSTLGIWRTFDPASTNPVRTFRLPGRAIARLSPDGRSVAVAVDVALPVPAGLTPQKQVEWQLQNGPGPYSTRRLHLYDLSSGQLLADLPDRDTVTDPVFSADGQVLISVFDPNPAPPQAAMYRRAGLQPPARLSTPAPATPTTMPAPTIERYSVRTGKRLSAVPAPAGLRSIIPFADGAFAVLDYPASPAGGMTISSMATDLRGWGTPTAGGLSAPGAIAWRGAQVRLAVPFSDGRRMLKSEGWAGTPGVYGLDSAQPLALLGDSVVGAHRGAISPNSQRVAIAATDAVRVYRKIGLECRESHLGVLGMPHVWLLGWLLVTLALSLRNDARRSPSAAACPPGTLLLATAMLALALPRTFHALLAALTGELLYSPAPLVLVCAIGLAAGGRFWRLAAVAVLAGVLSVNAYCAFDLRRTGFATPYALELIDRTFELPRLPIFAAMATLALLALAAMIQLVRPPPPTND